MLAIAAIVRLTIDLLGGDAQRASDAVKSLLPIAAAAVGLPLIIWRLVILNEQTRISEAKTEIDRQTHYTSIFSRSIEQLGQTREIKETLGDEGERETVSRTVPNIEVRLGGIHSLTRLAEESSRDRQTIENILRSYVRENSWSDRDGRAFKLPQGSFPSPSKWRFALGLDRNSKEMKEALNKWRSDSKAHVTAQTTWIRPLSETRVDVNEAIDAIARVNEASPIPHQGRFYESLFVGRLFKGDVLSLSGFERCTFVNCTFELKNIPELNFVNCKILNSRISTKKSILEIRASDVVECDFEETLNSTVRISGSNIYGSYFRRYENSSFEFPYCKINGGWFGVDETPATFIAPNATISQFNMTNVRFGPDSDFRRAVFVDSSFDKADLTEVTLINDTTLRQLGANPRTLHPKMAERPRFWPPYDPDYEDPDEIPF